MTGPLTLVTGASSGIGAEIARQLSSSRRLLLGGRSAERLEAVRSSCERPESHRTWRWDLSDVPGIAASLEEALAGEVVDAFIHSAGTLELTAFRTMPTERMIGIFNVNYFSAVEIVRLLSRAALNQRALRNVILISSGASRVGEKGNAIYAASKGALNAFMRSLAIELAPRVRVNSILPGMVRTPMSEIALSRADAEAVIAANYPLGRGEPRDIAWLAEFLLSEKARWITGQEVVVDGGYTAHANHVS
jgi:NAD(P)-dependent dehydrogenase (short-subunit alcohol dehydrogenase family)